jgi:uncharacterized membrane protein YeiH
MITATFGGVARDVMVAEVPMLFRPGGLYATCVFAGAWAFLGLQTLGVRPTVASLTGSAVIVGMRMASVWFGLSLPAPHWLTTLRATGEYPVER